MLKWKVCQWLAAIIAKRKKIQHAGCDKEINRLRLIIKDYAFICKSLYREVYELRKAQDNGQRV